MNTIITNNIKHITAFLNQDFDNLSKFKIEISTYFCQNSYRYLLEDNLLCFIDSKNKSSLANCIPDYTFFKTLCLSSLGLDYGKKFKLNKGCKDFTFSENKVDCYDEFATIQNDNKLRFLKFISEIISYANCDLRNDTVNFMIKYIKL